MEQIKYVVKRPDGLLSKPMSIEQVQMLAETGLIEGCTIAVEGTDRFVAPEHVLGPWVNGRPPEGEQAWRLPDSADPVHDLDRNDFGFDLPSPEELELPSSEGPAAAAIDPVQAGGPSREAPVHLENIESVKALDMPEIPVASRQQEDADIPPAEGFVLPDADGFETAEAEEEGEGKVEGYSIKNPDGLILGPMSIQEVTELIRSGGLSPKDPVSVDGADFVAAEELPELAVLFQRRIPERREIAEPYQDSSTSEPVPADRSAGQGSGVGQEFVPEVGAADAINGDGSEWNKLDLPPIEDIGGMQGQDVGAAANPREREGKVETEGNVSRQEMEQPQYTTPLAAWPELSGRIEERSIPSVIYQIFKEKRDGLLELKREKDKKTIFFKHGKPVRVQSTVVGERFGDVLVQRGLLTEQQLMQAIESAKQQGSYLGAELVRMGLLSAPVLFQMLGDVIKNQIVSSFAWTDGEFTFLQEKVKRPEHVAAEVDPIHLLRDGIARHFDLHRLLGPACLGSLMQGKIRINDPSGNALQSLKLPPREYRLAAALKDGMVLKEAYQAMHRETREEVKAARLMFLLVTTEVISVEVEAGEGEQSVEDARGEGSYTGSEGFTGEVDFGNVELDEQEEAAAPDLDLLHEPNKVVPGIEASNAPGAHAQYDFEAEEPLQPVAGSGQAQVAGGVQEMPGMDPVPETGGGGQGAEPPGFVMPEVAEHDKEGQGGTGFRLLADDGPAPVVRVGAGKPTAGADPSNSSGASEEDDLEEYRRLAADLEKKDYFEVMGLARDCTDEDVRARYMALVKKHHPDAGGVVSEEVRKYKERIFSRIGEAFEALKTKEKRDAYIAHIEGGGDTSELSGDQVDVNPIFESEELFMQGKRLIKAQRYDQAVERLQKAIELYKGNPAYHANLAYAKMMRAGPSNTKAISETARFLVKLLEESPGMEDGWMLLGYVYKRAGQLEYALRTFERVLELNRYNNEAASEVRYLKKKLEGGGHKKGFFS